EEAATISFFEANKGAWRMMQPSQELQISRTQQDQLGMTHLLFDQYHQGVRVVGAQLRSHFSSDGELRTVNGYYVADLDVDVAPVLTSEAAVQRALEHLATIFGTARPDDPELVVFRWEGFDYLCWRTFLWSDSPMGRWEYLVDAHSGEIVFNANRIMDANDVGTGIGVMGQWRYHIDTDWNGSQYQMRDYTRQTANNPHGHDGQMPSGSYIQTNIAGGSLPGSIATDADNTWDLSSQAPAVDGHVYSMLMYDYMLGHFGRNSFDGSGSTMLTSVNYSAEGDNNAYWNGSQIVVWSWSTGWRSLAGCPDVIAHEWGHAVTDYGSNLVYQLESGALNESFSDMLGAAFEFAHDSMDTPDWLMGENGTTSGSGFRDMENPHNNGDPDFYGTSDPYWVDVDGCSPSPFNDYCGVHTNSGVGNKWFSLLSDGGTHHSVTITGIGHQNAILIAWRANEFYWGVNTDYHEAALGTISAANDLDPTGAWTVQVANAWNAVGVSTPGPSLVFSYPLGVPEILTPGAETTFEVVVSGQLGGVPVAGSGRLFYRINGSGWLDDPMTSLADNHYEATLPAIDCGSVLEFYVRAREAASAYFYDPDPSAPYRADPATNVITVFADDFETNQGWTVSGDAGDGQWNRGDPVGGGDRGDPPDDFDGSGQCYLTDNVDGNSDVDDGTTILTSPTIDLSVGDAKIHYARWYSNNNGADPNNDEMYVRVSDDDGANWVLVETVGPVNEAGGSWYENSFVVSNFVTPTSQVKVRFEVSDLNAGSVIEAAIDDVTVIVYECEQNRPQIVEEDIPDWTEGRPYSEQLQVSGGAAPYVWSDKDGDLVGTGLSLSAGGLVSGTPLSSGGHFFTAMVLDDSGYTDEQLLTFTINPPVQVTTTSLPDQTAGASYSQTLTGTGGTGTLLWSDKFDDLIGTGLSLSTGGVVSGTPTAGAVSFTAVATDQVGANGEQVLSMTINPELVISTGTLPDGVQGAEYSLQIASTGGTGNQTWSDKNNDLTGSGLTLTPTGLLMGIPFVAGEVSFTARVTDEGGGDAEKFFSFDIAAAVGIVTAGLPDWTVNAAYSQQLDAAGGSSPYTWVDRDGDLVGTGLTLSTDGLLSGTPTSVGGITFWALVTDDVAGTDERQFSITINPELQFTTIVLPDWTQGIAFSEQIFTSGGTGAKTFSDQASELTGTGLTLSSTGQVSGVPLAVGPISFTALVTDEGGGSATQPFAFTINVPIAVTTTSLPDGAVDASYTEQLESSGGTGAAHWTDKNGDLVGTGLTLSESGLLSGTVALEQIITFTAQVTDDVGSVDESVLAFEIFLSFVCADIDNDGEGPNISDLVYLVDFMFNGGPPPDIMAAADFDADDQITIADLVALVDFMFNGGAPVTCD
ncbi:MAG: M4 family metallopeptidase, partial [candidate division Zixibacteria bacterium]|nr:M4 family metallopeptidase [candidate division Zixibacteria bacterium]